MYLVVQPHLFRLIISPCLFSELTLHQKPSGETGPSVRKVTTFKLSSNMPKETKRIRGTARFYEDESFDFIPQQQGAPVQKDVTRVRKSTCYQTNGEKESSYVMHLNVDADSIDPAAELTDDFDRLLKRISPKAEKKLSGKKLMDEDGTSVVVSRKEHTIQIPAPHLLPRGGEVREGAAPTNLPEGRLTYSLSPSGESEGGWGQFFLRIRFIATFLVVAVDDGVDGQLLGLAFAEQRGVLAATYAPHD